jgi:type II secretory pathway component PulC
MRRIHLRGIQTRLPRTVGRMGCSGALMLFLLCGALPVTWAQGNVPDRAQERFSGGFERATLDGLIEFVADVTGKRFIVDPRVEGSVTLSVESQTAQQCFETLLALLRQRGFDVVQEGTDVSILPSAATLRSPPSDAPSRVIATAARAAALQPLVPEQTDAAPKITLRAVQVNGVQRGYYVYPRDEAGPFTRLGLNPGDLVSNINGRSLADPVQGERIFEAAMAASEVTVRLERAGQSLYLRLSKRPPSGWLALASDSARAARSQPIFGFASPGGAVAGDARTFMRRQPVFAGGKLLGYRLYPRAGSLEFEKQGLRAGDLVTFINGRALDDPQRSDQVFDAALDSGPAILQVQRAGESLQVTLQQAPQQ